MARLTSLRQSGKLDTTRKIPVDKPALSVASPSHRIERNGYESEDGDTWLQASMPSLYGPHSDRHWVEMLRALTRGDNEGIAHASHPESQPTKS